jgi:hypothetical protein
MVAEELTPIIEKHLQEFALENITFEIKPNSMRLDNIEEFGWNVILIPSHLPYRMTPYYEELARVEAEILAQYGVKVFFVTGQLKNVSESDFVGVCTVGRVRKRNATPEKVLQVVKENLKDFPVDGMTFEIEEKCVREGEFGWRVVLSPSHLPDRMTYYYEELAIIEENIAEKEGFRVFFTTGQPQNLLTEVT